MNYIITIDGPSGAGKSTMAKNIAKELNINYFSSGLIFRTVGYKLLKENIALWEEEKILDILKEIVFQINDGKVFLEGEILSTELRTPEVTKMAIDIAVIEIYHSFLIKLQRKIFSGCDFIIEGRETSTILFPESDFKIFLDADINVRARRIFEDQNKIDSSLTFEEVLEETKLRDFKDYHEKGDSCLKILPEALYIDSTNLTLKEVQAEILNYIKKEV